MNNWKVKVAQALFAVMIVSMGYQFFYGSLQTFGVLHLIAGFMAYAIYSPSPFSLKDWGVVKTAICFFATLFGIFSLFFLASLDATDSMKVSSK